MSINSSVELEPLNKNQDHNEEELEGDAAPNSTPKMNTQRETGGGDSTHEEDSSETDFRKLGNQEFIRKASVNASLIALWYFFSISISVYNKWMFSSDNLDFHFPLFTTSGHMLVQFILASLVLFLFPQLRPQNAILRSEDASGQSQPEPRDPSKPLMTLRFYLTRIVSTGLVTGLDIGLGNTSLKFITLTFFTMCKSSTLGFVLAFAIIFRLEKPSWKIGAIILVMTVGVVMMVAGETEFNTIGFVLLMSSSFFSGLRWSLTQILLRRTAATSNPFATLFFLTPVMFFSLLILAFPSEGAGQLKEGLNQLAKTKGLALGIAILLAPGVLAFLMTSAEFALLQRTSVVTLSVCGIFKEVLTISAAGVVFGDTLTTINISGLFITICAIAAYNVIRVKKMQKKAIIKAQEENGEERAPMLAQEQSTQTNIMSDSRANSVRSRANSAAVPGSRPAPNSSLQEEDESARKLQYVDR